MASHPILDFSTPLDVNAFDALVHQLHQTGDPQAQDILVRWQNHEQAWMRVDGILERSSSPQAKVIAINVLLECVKTKWKIMPQNQRDGVRSFIVSLIITSSRDAETLRREHLIVKKLDILLVQILKHEWPHNWPNFIPDLVESSKTSESLCANNMDILLILSEEIFDYSAGHMTQAKIQEMKSSLNKEFALIFQLCEFILQNSMDQNLLSTTLKTLLRFLNWIPLGYIFETTLLETLVSKFFPASLFQNDTLQCLTEIASLKETPPQYDVKFQHLFVAVMNQVEQDVITPQINIAKEFKKGNPKVTEFVLRLSLFLTGFLKTHLDLVEKEENCKNHLIFALTTMLMLSEVDDRVVFNICLDYWNDFVNELYSSSRSGGMGFGGYNRGLRLGVQSQSSMRSQMYAGILSTLRRVLISKMAKPEEVLIVQDENNQIVRESLRDTDSIVLYKNMRECLILLTHLNQDDTKQIMLQKLQGQVDGTEWSWHNLNTLCWAIGSISGSLSEVQEKDFLVKVIKVLLGLCENKSGKNHKAVIASNIMYVVGQYPRFLRQHWKFLKTVVNKLFEFMHEKHPGVQDMSCDTFLKIAKSCRRKFVVDQVPAPSDAGGFDSRPFIEEILMKLQETISDLEDSQIHTFYEAAGVIIQSQTDPEKRQDLVFKLMVLPNQSWASIVNKAKSNTDPNFLWYPDTVKQVVLVLKTNNRVASALGNGYQLQLSRIYLEMLQVYKLYSQHISQNIETHGVIATKNADIRQMRAVKKEILKLVSSYIRACQDSDKQSIYQHFFPPLLDPVLDDYSRNLPDARDAEVLALFETIINKMGSDMTDSIPRIFESVIRPTLSMIISTQTEFPDHRRNLFRLIREMNSKAFEALLKLNAEQFRLIMDAIIFATTHMDRNIAEAGLHTLHELVQNMEKSAFTNDFFKGFLCRLYEEVLTITTDTLHKPGFADQAKILSKLFSIVDGGSITVYLWDASQASFHNNQDYFKAYCIDRTCTMFKNLNKANVEKFITSCFAECRNEGHFKTLLRDFLCTLKEWEGASAEELYEDEKRRALEEARQQEEQRQMAVPGLLYTGPSATLSESVQQQIQQDHDEDL